MRKEIQKNLPFIDLKQGLLKFLETKSYSEGTLNNYKRSLTILETYMINEGIDTYTTVIGDEFIKDYLSKHDIGIARQKALVTIVRRLNDYCIGLDYTIQKKKEKEILPADYTAVLGLYLTHCRKIGNKKYTVVAKEAFCHSFLIRLYSFGCQKLQYWNSSYVCKACLKIDNKDAWAVIRMFLKFLNQNGVIEADYSTLIPHYKRAVIVPVTYSEKEIHRFEEAIDKTTNTGKRDYAMLLLATRLGMRSGDIAKLSFDELDFENEKIQLIQEKTGEPLELPLLPEIKKALLDYIYNARPISHGSSVFLRMIAPYQQITTATLRFVTTCYFRKAGIDISDKKHGPHTFRSSLASSMVNDQIPYDAVSKILGHTDSDAIKHYAKLDIEQLREYAIEVSEPSGIFKMFLDGGVIL